MIGSKKNSKVRFLRDMNFCWDPGIFQVLGIKFSTDTTQTSSINFEAKISEIRKILNNWSRRQITPLGKITVVKTLVLLKLTHLFVNLPDPTGDFLKEFDKMCFKFLWDGKQNKISKNVVCQLQEGGGLKMVNIYCFLSCMKITWLRRIS